MYNDEITIELTVEQAFELLEFLRESDDETNEGVEYVKEYLEYKLDEIEPLEFENDD